MHKHTIDLLERLLVATKDSRIQWAEVPGKTAYSYLAGEFVVLVDANPERTSFRLTDSKGRALEQADLDDLGAVNLGTGISALEAVQSIHTIAKRQAMGTDMAIASVMDHLQGLSLGETDAAAPETEEAGIEDAPFEEDIAPEAENPTEVEAALAEPEHLPEEAEHVEQELQVETAPEVQETSTTEIEINTRKDKKRKRSLLNPFGGKK